MAVPTSSDKWRYTLYTTVVLLLLFNPSTYKAVNYILGSFIGPIESSNGCPTHWGFLLHAIVFTIIVRYMMDLDI